MHNKTAHTIRSHKHDELVRLMNDQTRIVSIVSGFITEVSYGPNELLEVTINDGLGHVYVLPGMALIGTEGWLDDPPS